MSTVILEDVKALQEIVIRELPRWIEEEPAFRRCWRRSWRSSGSGSWITPIW